MPMELFEKVIITGQWKLIRRKHEQNWIKW
jgi:hypothetical protein